MLDSLSHQMIVTAVVLFASWICYAVFTGLFPRNLPKLPIAGSKESDWFPLLASRWRNSKNYAAVAQEVDTLYKDQACLVPIGGSETVVMLPASEAQHLVDLPDSVLNMPQPMIRGLQFKYTVVEQLVMDDPIHQKLVTGDLTRKMGQLVQDIYTETEWGFAKFWGTDTIELKEINVFDTLRRIIASATNRVFVGLPACRDPELVDAGMSYARALPQEAGKIRRFPTFVKPLVARFYTPETRASTKAFLEIIRPDIEQRIRDYRSNQMNAENKKSDRNDFLQWSIEQALNHPNPRHATPEVLAGRILMLNFGSIHTTSFTATHAIFDLFSSKQEYVEEIRDEVSAVLARNAGGWTKAALSQMVKLDSVIRESLRLNMASTFGVPRLVVGNHGFVTKSGIHIPCGNTVAVPGKTMGRDSAFFPDGDTFRPFRFVQDDKDESEDGTRRVRQAAATTTSTYLPFGHGRHACPGRFFATDELKMILGYMIINYDVEMLEKRPSDIYAGIAKLPPLASSIKVRRRRNV